MIAEQTKQSIATVQDKVNPDRLRQEYPGGFVLFFNKEKDLADYARGSWRWKMDEVLENTRVVGLDDRTLRVQVPIMGTTDLFARPMPRVPFLNVNLQRMEGAKQELVGGDAALWVEILQNEEQGVIWVLGYKGELPGE